MSPWFIKFQQQLDLSNTDSTVGTELETTIDGIMKSVEELKQQLEDTTFLQVVSKLKMVLLNGV